MQQHAATEPQQAGAREQATGPVRYFNSGMTSWPKAPGVAEAMARCIHEEPLFAGRGVASGGTGGDVKGTAGALRNAIAGLIRAESADRIVLTTGCTDALNTAIYSVLMAAAAPESPWAAQLGGEKPHAVTTVLEHKAVARALHQLQARGVIDLTVVGCGDDAIVDAADVLAATNERTAMVVMIHASNAFGTIQPVQAVGEGLKDKRPDAVFLVDAAQSAGVLDLDVGRMHADLLAFPAHKALRGPTGVGMLYVGPGAYPDHEKGPKRMLTVRQGGAGGGGVSMDMPVVLPNRFEPGTPNAVGQAGWLAAMEHVQAPAEVLAHERAVAKRLVDAVGQTDGVRLVGTKDVSRRTGVVTVVFDGKDPIQVAATMAERWGIACRGGDHCAIGAHEAMGTAQLGGAVRFSPGHGVSGEDVDALLDAIGVVAAE